MFNCWGFFCGNDDSDKSQQPLMTGDSKENYGLISEEPSILGGLNAQKFHVSNLKRLGQELQGSFGFVSYGDVRINGSIIKCIIKEPSSDPQAERFLRNEGKVLLSLKDKPDASEFVPLYIGWGISSMRLLMTCLPGSDLFDSLHFRKITTKEQKARVVYTLSLALEFVHKHHIIHRDLKPENIMVNDDFQAKLIDFGFAKQQPSDPNKIEVATLEPLGTEEYVAPERMRQLLCSDEKPTDIASLGYVIMAIDQEWTIAYRGYDKSKKTLFCNAKVNEALPDNFNYDRTDAPLVSYELLKSMMYYTPNTTGRVDKMHAKRPTATKVVESLKSEFESKQYRL